MQQIIKVDWAPNNSSNYSQWHLPNLKSQEKLLVCIIGTVTPHNEIFMALGEKCWMLQRCKVFDTKYLESDTKNELLHIQSGYTSLISCLSLCCCVTLSGSLRQLVGIASLKDHENSWHCKNRLISKLWSSSLSWNWTGGHPRVNSQCFPEDS